MTPSAMTPKKAAAYVVGAMLLAAWFASAVGVPPQSRPVRRVAPAAIDDARLDALAQDVQAQGSRLRKRLATAPGVQLPLRNPFSFERRDTPRLAPAVRTADQGLALEPAPVPEPARREPLLALIGVAEQKTADGLVRTAMISEDGEQLHMTVTGQEVAGRYVVVAVGPDAVDLREIATGLTRRLVLR